MHGSWKPVLVLFFLSPIIGELLSGSTPLLHFLNPFALFFLTGLYGSGAIIVREIIRRWGKGWASVLLLGAAYGVLEEGVMVKSFFDPSWPDLGLLGTYGRWLGVNWVWAEWLIIYHAIYSITIPIIFVELVFPEYRHIKYLSNRSLILFFALISFVVIFGHIFMTPYRLTFFELIGCFFTMAILIHLAKRVKHRRLGGSGGHVRSRWLWLLGTISGFTYFIIIFNYLPSIGVPVILTMLAGLGFTGLIAGLVLYASRNGLSGFNGLNLAAGFLTLLFFLSFILEAAKPGVKNYTGQAAVSIAFIILLILLGRKVLRNSLRLDSLYVETCLFH